MIGKGAQYLTAAGFGRYRITAASLGSLDLLGTCWLRDATMQAIMAAFGVDGTAVIAATNEYLNGIAASDKAKATALDGFINEDPMMVCSLGLSVPNFDMPSRAFVGDAASYLKLNVKADSTDYEVFMDAAIMQKKSGVPYFICSSTTRDSNHACNIYTPGGTTYNIWVGSTGQAGSFTPTVGKRYKNTVKVSGGRILWTEASLGTILDRAYSGTPVNNTEYYVFTHIGSLSGRCNYAAGYGGYIKKSGTLVCQIVPFIRNNVRGYLDLVTETFYTNQGTGTFGVLYTLQDGVTPWTPPTP